MNYCGIEIKGSEASCVVLDESENIIDQKTKFTLGSSAQSDLIKFSNDVSAFIKNSKIDVIVIKALTEKGRMTSGANAFRIETLIKSQAETCTILTAKLKKTDVINFIPNGLLKNRVNAYSVLIKNIKD